VAQTVLASADGAAVVAAFVVCALVVPLAVGAALRTWWWPMLALLPALFGGLVGSAFLPLGTGDLNAAAAVILWMFGGLPMTAIAAALGTGIGRLVRSRRARRRMGPHPAAAVGHEAR